MRILLCGGGTGGHITPILAIAHEIKTISPDSIIGYVGERNSKFSSLIKGSDLINDRSFIYAGKFRRYHKQDWLERIFDFKTNLLNLRDIFYVLFGFVQSVVLLKKYRPDVIFLKGGYVGLPLGIAASMLKIPFITHDSDTMASLTNTIVGKWALHNAVGSKPENYKYQQDKIIYVGIPVSKNYRHVGEKEKAEFRRQLNIPIKARVVLVMGGSLGASEVNKGFASIYEQLCREFSDIFIIHQVGKGKMWVYDGIRVDRKHIVREFIDDMYKYTGAADIVVTRGGASSIAELSLQGKTIIVIPNPLLTGGHQLKNAKVLSDNNAAIVVSETEIANNPEVLLKAITNLLNDNELSGQLARNIRHQSRPDSAKDIARILIETKK